MAVFVHPAIVVVMKNLTKLICQILAVLLLVSAAQAQNKTKVKKIDAPVSNGEICLGNTLVPKVTFTNVSASAINIKAQLLIANVVTGIKVYGDTVDVMNVAAGADVSVTFDTFKTNPNILSQLGTFNVIAIGPAMNGSGVIIGDALASDDTMRSTMFAASSSFRRSESRRSLRPGTAWMMSVNRVAPMSIALRIAPVQRRPISSTAVWNLGQTCRLISAVLVTI